MDRLQLDNREIPLLEPPLIDQDAPHQVLYVPMTSIGRADLWVRQHIKDLIPSQFLRPAIPPAGLIFGN